MDTERVSYCLLFFALVIASQGQRSLREVLRVLPVSSKVRELAGALGS